MKPGHAETALGAAVHRPGHLQGMQVVGRADPLDGGDPGAVLHAFHLGDAGADHLAVQDHRAAAALALAAADLGPGQFQLFPQHVRQHGVGLRDDGLRHAVDMEHLLDH